VPDRHGRVGFLSYGHVGKYITLPNVRSAVITERSFGRGPSGPAGRHLAVGEQGEDTEEPVRSTPGLMSVAGEGERTMPFTADSRVTAA